MKEKDTRMKKKTRKLEHWQVVTLLLCILWFYSSSIVLLSGSMDTVWLQIQQNRNKIFTGLWQKHPNLWTILRSSVLVSAPVQKHLALCQLFRITESSSSNPAHRICLHHRNVNLCREDACFLLFDRHRHPVLPDFGNPFFLSLCPAAERKDKPRGQMKRR